MSLYSGQDVVLQVTAVAVLLSVKWTWPGGGDFLEEVESWDGWAKGGELAVFEPNVVEVY
jgi:hypothetical protein